jgi:sugar phosphate isomerase/epimerase
MSARDFRHAVEDLGMTVSSNHGPFPTPENADEVIAMTRDLGCEWAVSGFGPDAYETLDAVERTAEKVNVATGLLADEGLGFCLHNHWWEFQPVAHGKLAYDLLLERCPGVRLEIDVYWASAFGANDVPGQVARLKDLTPLLHIKDGPGVKGEPHVAVGSGTMDIPAAIAAADPSVLQWLVIELDECGTDMMDAVEQSYRYLVGNGLASGNKPA